jgi:hypothetical protein
MLPESPDAPEPSPEVALPVVDDPDPDPPCAPDEDPVCAGVPLAATEPELGMLPLDAMDPEPGGGESLKASSPDVAPAPPPLVPLVLAAT